MTRFNGDRWPGFICAKKPANFDQLAAAAKAGDIDGFAIEAAKYRDQCIAEGVPPGRLLGLLDTTGGIS